ncbi:MAG: RNA-binding protein [Gammaproteobacteria bacterium]|nr:RNA-binding protein [Gammaproteobacteria bacterium]
MKIYVGNLPWRMTSADLEELFAQHGEVRSANVVMDRETGRSRGFGFVEMSDDGARSAIEELNETEVQSRRIRVSQARERSRDRKPYR